MGRSLDSLPEDLAAAIEAGKVPGSIVYRYFELEKSAVFRWLLQFGGFKERLLADDLFLAKVAMECGVGIFTKVCLFVFFCAFCFLIKFGFPRNAFLTSNCYCFKLRRFVLKTGWFGIELKIESEWI